MLMKENEPLARYTTLEIGGPARWFAQADTEDDVAEATAWARERGVPLFVLGGGSNLLVADAGFEGLTLHVQLRGIDVEADDAGNCIYRVAAGEDWDAFVERTVTDGCAGLECLAGIPGTVGGTPVQNVGAYGQEVASSIVQVRAFDLEQRAFVEFTKEECGFAYRRSRFNTEERGRYVVTRVDYRLTPGGAPTVRYADLQRALAETPEPTLIDVAAAVRQVRRAKGMLLVEGDADCRSAGSFFKNPVISEDQYEKIAASHAAPPRFPAGPEHGGCVKVPAAWLIEQAGFGKGCAAGHAGISSKHTLALINRGNATAAEMLALAERVSAAVDARFGVRLEMEPVRVGFE